MSFGCHARLIIIIFNIIYIIELMVMGKKSYLTDICELYCPLTGSHA